MKERERIANYAYAFQGDWDRIAKAIQQDRDVREYPIQEKYITFLDEAYPQQLRALRYPPWILFYQGDLSLLQRPMMTVVGSRQLSAYGEENTRKAVALLKEKYVIVSGLDKGADAAAHKTALQGGHTIAVVGCGIAQQYPSCNRLLYQRIGEHDLILSEYPGFVSPEKRYFPWRNRILAALGESCIVTQATLRSGTMLTVNEAISLSKDIWCFPYPFESEEGKGCNRLIEQGAGILYEEEQILDFVQNRCVRKE
jgi:DNA processing protein